MIDNFPPNIRVYERISIFHTRFGTAKKKKINLIQNFIGHNRKYLEKKARERDKQ
jgi:hypothetical protein